MVESVVNLLLGLRKLDGRKDAGFVWSRRTIAGRKEIFEFAQDIFGALAELRALFNQLMAAFAPRRINPSRNRKHLAAVFGGEVSSDERAAGEIGFNDHGAEGHARNNAVADRERLLVAG